MSDNHDYKVKIWKAIVGFNIYKVSNLNRVKSFKHRKEKIL